MTHKPESEAAEGPRIDARHDQGPTPCPNPESRLASWICGLALLVIVLASMFETGVQ